MGDEPEIQITAAQAVTTDGTVAATVTRILVGGGSQTVTVDGTPEERQHPASVTYHVRLHSPDPMVPDELREADGYEAAAELALRYAARVEEHAGTLRDLTENLKI